MFYFTVWRWWRWRWCDHGCPPASPPTWVEEERAKCGDLGREVIQDLSCSSDLHIWKFRDWQSVRRVSGSQNNVYGKFSNLIAHCSGMFSSICIRIWLPVINKGMDLQLVMAALHSRCGHYIGSWPSNDYFHSVCWFVCLSVCAEFISAVFYPILIKLRHMLYVWV